MIDEIFELILKEARSREGKDLALNIYTVLMDLHIQLFPAIEAIREQQRREKKDEI